MVIFKFFYFILIFFLCWGGGSFCCCYFGFFSCSGIDFVGGFFLCVCLHGSFFSFWVSTRAHIKILDVIFRVENSSFVQNKMKSTISLANPVRHSKCIQFPWTSKGMLSKSHARPDSTILKYHFFDQRAEVRGASFHRDRHPTDAAGMSHWCSTKELLISYSTCSLQKMKSGIWFPHLPEIAIWSQEAGLMALIAEHTAQSSALAALWLITVMGHHIWENFPSFKKKKIKMSDLFRSRGFLFNKLCRSRAKQVGKAIWAASSLLEGSECFKDTSWSCT